MDVVLLSRYPELKSECADLLNNQWQGSVTARVQSLVSCFAELPDSLLLLEKTEQESQVIGYVRLTRIVEDPHGCYITSVVIREDKRKRGYGKFIMEKAEEYAKVLQFSTVYLCAMDQRGFYEHLGYIYCNPVSSINSPCYGILQKQISNSSHTDYQSKKSSEQSENSKNHMIDSINSNSNQVESTLIPPASLAPPMKFDKCTSTCNQLESGFIQYWLKKEL